MVNWWSSPIQVRISVALRQMFGCIRWAIFANQTSMVRTGPKSASIIGRKSAWRTSDYSDYWIGLRENLHETMVFTIKYRDFLYFPIIQFYEVINLLTMRTMIHQDSSDVFQMITVFYHIFTRIHYSVSWTIIWTNIINHQQTYLWIPG